MPTELETQTTQTQTESTPATQAETSTSEPVTAKSAPPIEYTSFTAPEGTTLDPEAVKSATVIFKELGLSQIQAQRLVDFHIGRDATQSNKSAETYDKMRNDWRSEVEAHSTLGGTKLEETRGEIGKAIATLPPKLQESFKAAMDLTGAGDHPAVVEAFHIFAKSINEGKHVSGDGPSVEGQLKPGTVTRPSPAAAMFPNLPTTSH